MQFWSLSHPLYPNFWDIYSLPDRQLSFHHHGGLSVLLSASNTRSPTRLCFWPTAVSHLYVACQSSLGNMNQNFTAMQIIHRFIYQPSLIWLTPPWPSLEKLNFFKLTCSKTETTLVGVVSAIIKQCLHPLSSEALVSCFDSQLSFVQNYQNLILSPLQYCKNKTTLATTCCWNISICIHYIPLLACLDCTMHRSASQSGYVKFGNRGKNRQDINTAWKVACGSLESWSSYKIVWCPPLSTTKKP